MSDDPPRPQYGEYASPEEQARAAGQTYVPPFVPPRAGQQPEEPRDSTQPDVPIFNRGRFIDRVVTNGLLLIGVFSAIQSFGGDLAFSTQLKAIATEFGVSNFSPSASLDVVGRWLLLINVVVLVASIAVSVVVARRGHITFYIPIAGFFLFSLAQAILVYSSAPTLFEQIGRHFLG